MNFTVDLQGEDEVQMAPMIDMVFLLLIFFMAASHLNQLDRPELEVPIADHAAVARELAGRRTISVKADGQIYLGNTPSSLEAIGPAVAEARRNLPEVKIVLRADRNLPHAAVRDVMKACADAGAAEILFTAYESE